MFETPSSGGYVYLSIYLYRWIIDLFIYLSVCLSIYLYRHEFRLTFISICAPEIRRRNCANCLRRRRAAAMYIYLSIYIDGSIDLFIFLYIDLSIYRHLHEFRSTLVYIYGLTHISIYIHTHIIYIYMFICIYVYIHTCIYICTNRFAH